MLYYRRRLPHWIPDGAVIFVTWRLADSGPPGRTPGRDEVLDYARADPRWLHQPRVARIVENALQYGDAGYGFYTLYAWVIMPNHVHAVFQPKAALPNVMRWLKGRTSRVVNRVLGRTGLPLWQDESYDHWIRSSKELQEVIAYVENNPVKAGLVETADQWPWSSARFRPDDPTRSSAPRDS